VFLCDDNNSRIRDYTGGDGQHTGNAALSNGTTKFAVEINPGVALRSSTNGEPIVATSCTVADPASRWITSPSSAMSSRR
jgi:hypothetical protein